MKKRVLLVDDEPNIIIPIEFLMQQQGFEVDKAFNGPEALVRMEENTPDVVILDVMMPGMNGFEVAEEIRKNSNYDSTRIVFLTAKSASDDKLSGYSKGGEVYITKPFDNAQLVQTVIELMKFG